VGLQLLDQGGRDRIVARDDDVIPRPGRQLAGSAVAGLGLDPGAVKELDEHEGEQGQQEDHPGQQHDDGERLAQVRREGDVAEAQRGHDREGPVHPRDPGVILPFRGHDVMEDDAVDGHHAREHEHEIEELTEVAPGAGPLEKIADDGGIEFHGPSPPGW